MSQLLPGVQESWDKIHAEREEIYLREKNRIFAELDTANAKTYKGDKHQETIDRIIGASKASGKIAKGMPKEGSGNILADVGSIQITTIKRKRGRPVGSKNKAKPELVKPSLIGHIPPDDFIVRRG